MSENLIDKNIVKFGFYGFLKNLQFFEPFIYLYFLAVGLNYFQIGIILSIREISTYVFEIPTGVIADTWGKKRSMLLCFTFYSISFAVYWTAETFWIIALASVFFGLGEAFRQGTHKAIIFDYLDYRGIPDRKSEVYGFTSAVAQVGSALSAILAAALLLWRRDYHLIFLFSIIPYAAAFMLILTYPPEKRNYEEGQSLGRLMWEHAKESLGVLTNIGSLHHVLMNSSTFDGTFMASRDYVQPLVRDFLVAAPVLAVLGDDFTQETVTVSLLYLLLHLVGAVASRYAYRINDYFSSPLGPLNAIFIGQALVLFLVGLFSEISLIAVFLLFLLLKAAMYSRRPLLLAHLDKQIDEKQRATMLSIENQLRALTVVVVAPILGAIAEYFSLRIMFMSAGGAMALLYFVALRFKEN